jgi:hypothetical protein
MSSRHPLMAAAERACDDGAVLSIVVYMTEDGAVGFYAAGDDAPCQLLGMLTKAQLMLMVPDVVDEPDE